MTSHKLQKGEKICIIRTIAPIVLFSLTLIHIARVSICLSIPSHKHQKLEDDRVTTPPKSPVHKTEQESMHLSKRLHNKDTAADLHKK